MRMRFETSGSFDRTIKHLRKLGRKDFRNALNQIGDLGTPILSANTPVGDTGETAAGWTKVVKKNEVGWANNAHPNESVNIAKIIQTGHGTGTGGYVPPHDYIGPSMDAIAERASQIIEKELTD